MEILHNFAQNEFVVTLSSLAPFVALELSSILFAPAVFASSTNEISQYSSRLWQMDEGLPHNSVHALAQTRDGYLWVGTAGGLARFDGVRFTVFDQKTTPEIRSRSVTALCEGREGSFWIGTEGGLTRLKDGA